MYSIYASFHLAYYFETLPQKTHSAQHCRSFLAGSHSLHAHYLPVDGIKVYVGLLGPLLPELGVVKRDVVAVLGGHKAGLGEGGALALTLNGDGGGSALQDLVDVLLAETTALVILVHDRGIGALPQ